MRASFVAVSLFACLALAAVSPPSAAQPKAGSAVASVRPPPTPSPALAFTNARVHTGAGAVIDDATIVIASGMIQRIGKGIAPPAGAEVTSLRGLEVTPGFVDVLTQVGVVEVELEGDTHDDQEKATRDTVHAGFRAADGYNPASTLIDVTRLQGLTSVGVVPTGGLVSGQSAWADLDGATAASALAATSLALHVHLDAEAQGERAGHATAILRVREAFDDARAFSKARGAYEHNQTRPFAPSRLDLEALTRALDGKLPVVFHVNRAADILTALGLAKEFALRLIIAGGAEAWQVAPALAAAKVPVIVLPLAQPTSFETLGTREDNAALLHAAGVSVVLSTGATHLSRKLRQVAGNAVRSGLPHEAAITALTRAPAEAFGMSARYGTLEAGKVANLVVWSGDPLELATHVRSVVIRGKSVPLRSRQTALLDKYRTLPPH